MRDSYYSDASVLDARLDENAVNGYVAKVFGWMFIGLLVTCLSTLGIVYGVNISDAFAGFIANLSRVVFIVFIVEVLLVGVISARVAKMNPTTAILLYLLYAVLNGFTVGLFAMLYAGNMATLGLAVGITALSFGVMAVYGLVTKSDVTKAGNLLKMGLVGLIIMSVVNIFLGNGMLDFVICLVGLFIFLGLTAYDTKKIKTYYASVALAGGTRIGSTHADGNASNTASLSYDRLDYDQNALASNLAIVGALTLYLDFINMFLFILRLINGGRK